MKQAKIVLGNVNKQRAKAMVELNRNKLLPSLVFPGPFQIGKHMVSMQSGSLLKLSDWIGGCEHRGMDYEIVKLGN